ncbi:hypothetical protein VIGAN_06085000 [Vigna angularis var. angularis]|uniref:Uncharacterized protein n=1 Tax=Vigna angularis var. angularis TaxID=157739 RepID=A0A0S3SAH1_PHAAN|nr:hypothetical protein VIGAN_06085000 [Vigna angularis var. angularis]
MKIYMLEKLNILQKYVLKNARLHLAHERKRYSVMVMRMMPHKHGTITCNLCIFYLYTGLIRYLPSFGLIGQGFLVCGY